MSNINVITGNKNREQFLNAIKLLHRNKPLKKRLLKAVEELSELSTAILQRINKGTGDENVLEETVDAFMHIEMLLMLFDPEEVKKMYEAKSSKFLNHKDLTKYKDAVLV